MKIDTTKQLEIVVLSIIAGIFIYYRKLDYYKSIPRKNAVASFLIIGWTYLVLYVSPWFLLVGLVLLNVYGEKHKRLKM